MWSHPGVGPRPNLRLAGEKSEGTQILVYSPFANRILSLKFLDGKLQWERTLPERVPYAPLPLTESVLVQGDQGTLWALRRESGDIQWETAAPEPLDFPIAPPRFRDKAVFTLSRDGILRKLGPNGTILGVAQQPNRWGTRKAKTVPLRSFHSQLSYLDQSGRLITYDPSDLSKEVQSLWPPEGQLIRAYGESREALAGALSPDRSHLWMVELPGVLRAYSLSSHTEVWKVLLEEPHELFSSEGELLALPTVVSTESLSAIFLTTRHRVVIRDAGKGRTLFNFALPSEALRPPVYDGAKKRWWILCHKHLVTVDQTLQTETFELPIVEKPFSLRLRKNLAIVTTSKGRIFGLKLPDNI